MRRVYLIRYGVARSVAPFAVDPDEDNAGIWPTEPLTRGQVVVVRTHRGIELGEVLSEASASVQSEPLRSNLNVAPLLRVATSADLMQAQQAATRRAAHFAACQAIFSEGVWPLQLIDAEPLLDERRTVVHYLGPHHLDAAGLVAIFRDQCDLDIVLEPVGLDLDDDGTESVTQENLDSSQHHCGSCGSKSGGCGSCSAGGGGCALKTLVQNRRKSS